MLLLAGWLTVWLVVLVVLARGRRLPVLAVVEGRRRRRRLVVLVWRGRRRRVVGERWALVWADAGGRRSGAEAPPA